MKRILLLLLLAVHGRVNAQAFLTNLNNFRTFNAGYGALTGTSVIHPPMVFGNVDSACNYIAQLYALIGAAGNLQAVTAVGNSTTYSMYSGVTGTSASPGTGTYLNNEGGITDYAGGALTGGIFSTGIIGYGNTTQFQSVSQPAGFFGGIYAAQGLTGTRYITIPDDGSGFAGGVGSDIVIHHTQYPDTIGNLSVIGVVINTTGMYVYETGTIVAYYGNDGSGSGEVLLTNSTYNQVSVLKPDTTNLSVNDWLPPVANTVLASRDDTASSSKSGSMKNLLTLTSGVTPAGVYTLTNKRIAARDSAATNYAGGAVTYNTDNYDGATISALANTLNFVNPAGTPTNKQFFNIAVKDNGSAQTIAWGTNFTGGSTNALPLTTVISKALILDFEYLTIDNKWHLVGVDEE